MDSTRRTVLATGVAAAAAAAVPQAFAQTSPGKGAAGSFFEKGSVRIHYQEVGSGFPLLLIPGGGLNSTIGWMSKGAPFNAIEEFKSEFRVVTADMRNAYDGQSTGPLEAERPWDAYTDDQLALMDHLGHKKFMVMGFCIGGPFVWNLLKRAPDRVVAGVAAQPSGFRPELPTLSYDGNMKGWGPEIVKRRPGFRLHRVARFRAFVQDAGAGHARRLAAASVRGRDGIRDARAEVGGEPVPVEGAEGSDPGRGAAGALVPARASARHCGEL